MGKAAKIRYLMIGTCLRCGKEFVRPAPCDVAACTCESAVEVPLSPAILLPPRIFRRFHKIADKAGVSIEDVVNAVLEWGFERGDRKRDKREIKKVYRSMVTRNQEAT